MNKNDTNLASLDLNLITALNALLDHQSVSKAAKVVGRTQSAMSHSLSRLRDHFQDPILVRDGWAMRLTPFGDELRSRAGAAASAAHLLFETKAEFDPATTKRRIRITTPDLCTSLFTGFIRELTNHAPFAAVEFVVSDDVRQAVLKSDADVGLGFGHPKADPNLVLHKIAPLSWCTFVPRDHSYCADISQETWITSRHVVVGQSGTKEGPVERVLKKNGLKRYVACYASNFSEALSLAAEANMLFTTLRAPFERAAKNLGMVACPLPFTMQEAPASLIFRADYGDPFSIWVREQCLHTLI